MNTEQLKASHESGLRSYYARGKFRAHEHPEFNSQHIPSVSDIRKFSEGNIQNALARNGSRQLPEHTLNEVIHNLRNIALLIESQGRGTRKWKRFESIADSVGLIVNFSAPGLYTDPWKEDNYKDYPYMNYGDRRLADAAAKMGIIIGGIRNGTDYRKILEDPILTGFEPDFAPYRDNIQSAVKLSNIQFAYYGKKEEADAVKKALKGTRAYIPEDSVTFHTNGIIDTLDQTKQLGKDLRAALEIGSLKPGQIIVMPVLSQAVRILPMMKEQETIPDELTLALMPVPTTTPGVSEYVQREISKTMWSIINGDAAIQPQRAIIL